DGRLVARIDVGPLVAVHLYGYEMLVDDFRDHRIFVALAVNDVAPVTPHRADIQQDRLVMGFGPRKGVVAPFVPINGLMRRGTQIWASGIFQTVFASQEWVAALAFRAAARLGRRALQSYCTCEPGPGSRGSSGLRPA